MARSMQISNNFSVKHEPNFLIFLLPFLSISQIKKFGGLRKYAEISVKQLPSYEPCRCYIHWHKKKKMKL